MTAANVPTFKPGPALLAIDSAACTINRYQRAPLGRFDKQECRIEPAAAMGQLGTDEARAMIEKFRVTGQA